jgi:hypothetical protein
VDGEPLRFSGQHFAHRAKVVEHRGLRARLAAERNHQVLHDQALPVAFHPPALGQRFWRRLDLPLFETEQIHEFVNRAGVTAKRVQPDDVGERLGVLSLDESRTQRFARGAVHGALTTTRHEHHAAAHQIVQHRAHLAFVVASETLGDAVSRRTKPAFIMLLQAMTRAR